MVGDQAAALLSLLALVGLLASLMGIMFAYGRNMYSLSRAGYYPRWLSLTGARKTPWVALVFGAALGFVALVVVQAAGGDASPAGAIVLNIAVWGAVLAYFLQMVSFIILRRKFPNAVRPYKSPWGLFGAYSAAVIAAIVFFGLLFNPTYLLAIVAIIVVYAVISSPSRSTVAIDSSSPPKRSTPCPAACTATPKRGLRRHGGRGVREERRRLNPGTTRGGCRPASTPRDVQRRMNDAVPDDGMPPMDTLR